MAITAAEVKKLRDATGAGMMDAKKALTEAEGDFDAAVEILRVTGQAKMAKRSDREASNGLVAASGKSVIQLGAETDFVAKNARVHRTRRRDRHRDRRGRAGDAASRQRGAARLRKDRGAHRRRPGRRSARSWSSANARTRRRPSASTCTGVPPTSSRSASSSNTPVPTPTPRPERRDADRGDAPQYLTRDEVPADLLENERRIAEADREGRGQARPGRRRGSSKAG